MVNKNLLANRYLDAKGIKHSYRGFRYLITAIEIGSDNPNLLYKVSDLYENIAQIYGTSQANVERSIRYSVLSSGLSNKEFILRAVDSINYSNM